jgi:hypothetical protein
LLTKTERYSVGLISELQDEDVRRMGMTPFRTLSDALAQARPDTVGYILPRGAAILPLISAQGPVS